MTRKRKSTASREIEAERALVGALLLDPAAHSRIAGAVGPDDLINERNAAIFRAVLEVASSGRAIDAVTVRDRLEALGQLEAAGGADYLADLVESTASAANVEGYAQLVRDHAARRRLIKIGERLAAGANDSRSVVEILDEHDAAMAGIRIRSTAASLALVSLDDFAERPKLSWLVQDLIPAQGIVVFFGGPKSGKTFIVVDLLLHGAHGMSSWHGYRIPRALRVAYLAGEGIAGLRVRFHAWVRGHGTDLRGDFRVLAEALPLASRLGELLELLRKFEPDIVAIDTLNAFFGALDENATADMTAFIAAVRRLRDELGCAVVLVHHVGHGDAGRERGSSVLRGAVDVAVQVARDDDADDGHIGAQVVAARDMETWESPLSLRLVPADTDWADDEGQPITSRLVVRGDRPVSLPGRSGRPLTRNQQAIASAVRELAAEKGNGSGKVLLARADVISRAVAEGASRSGAYRALDDLARRMSWRTLEPGSIEVPVP